MLALVPGPAIDLSTALLLAAAKGYDTAALADLLPEIQAGLMRGLRKIEEGE